MEKNILLVLTRSCFPGKRGEAEVSCRRGSPAVHHYGSCVLGVTGLHLLQELQHPDGSEGHPEIRPAGEVELRDEALRLLVRDVAYLQGKGRLGFIPNT